MLMTSLRCCEAHPKEGKIQYFVGLTRTVLTLEEEDLA